MCYGALMYSYGVLLVQNICCGGIGTNLTKSLDPGENEKGTRWNQPLPQCIMGALLSRALSNQRNVYSTVGKHHHHHVSGMCR